VSRTILDEPLAAPKPIATPGPVVVVQPNVAVALSAGGRRRALCVGIDAYDPPNQLSGCVNDANDWVSALQGLGFEVATLFDAAATWQGLRSALTDLVGSSRPGDVIVFQYAGHGTRVADLDGDEPSGSDSALCPVDFPAGGFLIDDDVRAIFGALPDGVNLTCFFDCCHSGTITRFLAAGPAVRPGASIKVRGIRATAQMEAAHRSFRASMRSLAPAPRDASTMREVSFTACTDEQTAKEIDGHGQFTARAIPLLRSAAGLTNSVFHERIVAAFAGTALDQDPRLDCASSAKIRQLLAPLTDRGVSIGPASDLQAIAARLASIERRLSALER
jgi:hypothetical protein